MSLKAFVDTSSIDEKAGTVKAVVSTIRADREGQIVLPEAIMAGLSDFFSNPVFLWGHKHNGDPKYVIGTVEKIEQVGDSVVATFQYDLADPFAAEVFGKVVRRVIRAFSIGFIMEDWQFEPGPDLRGDVNELLKSGAVWLVHTKVSLIEISQVIIPAHPDAVIRALGKLGAETLKKLKLNPDKKSKRKKSQETQKSTVKERSMNPEEIVLAIAKQYGVEIEIKQAKPAESNVQEIVDARVKSLEDRFDQLEASFGEALEELTNLILGEADEAEGEADEATDAQ